MSAYITQFCKTHGEWDMDVDNVSECPACEEQGLTLVQRQAATIDALVSALEIFMRAEEEFRGDVTSHDPGAYDDPLAEAYDVARAALAAVKEKK